MSKNRSDYIAPQEQIAIDSKLDPPSHSEIAALAQTLWLERGGGDGGAEEDWLKAERMLSEQYSNGHAE